MLLAVNMIVKDEAADVVAALDSVRGLADAVVVHDTGSTDGTPDLARAAGAEVVRGAWHGDFAAARDVPLRRTRARWVLSLDADERFTGEPEALRSLLAATPRPAAFAVTVRNPRPDSLGGDFDHAAVRLFSRGGARWSGTLHEVPVGPWGPPRRLPPETGALLHLGYADPDLVQRKAARNAALAQAQLDRLVVEGCSDPDRVGPVLVDLGRALMAAGAPQRAVESFEAARELLPGTRAWAEATDLLARLLLGDGQHGAVLVLVDQLRTAPTATRSYCDWLAATALANTGRVEEALVLLRGVDRLVDPAGREHDPGQAVELHAVVAAAAGRRQEAAAAALACLARHGRVRGRGALLLELWADTPAERLAAALVAAGPDHIPAVAAELAGLGGRGAAVAAGLLPAA